MFAYYITIALTALLASIAQTSRYRERGSNGLLPDRCSRVTKILLLLSVLPLVFTAGLRYNIGTDFGAYYRANQVFTKSIWDALIHFNEPGIVVLTRLTALFTEDGAAFIFVFSASTILLSVKAIYNETDDYLFAILLYVFCGLWHGCFNGVRQYLAATVLLYSHHFIREKKLIKYVLTVILAALFHVSAIVMLPLYFIMRNRLKLSNILLLCIITVILSQNYDAIFTLAGILKEQTVVMNEYATHAVSIFRILVNCAPALLAIIMYWNKQTDQKQTFYINGLIINAAAMISASGSAYLSRIGIYTGFFVPIGMAELVKLKNKQLQHYIRFIMILLYFVYWYIDVSRASSLNPFHWVWSR